MKIGFPRALYYFDYFPFWAGFFRHLNIEVVTSPPTQRRIMELGLKNANDETCLPLKLLAGHIQSLRGVDWIFLPRMVSVETDTYTCPKFLGIPESVLSAVPEGIPVLSVTLNWRKGQRQVIKDLQEMAEQLGKSKSDIQKAFFEGQDWQKRFETARGKDWNPEESFQGLAGIPEGQIPSGQDRTRSITTWKDLMIGKMLGTGQEQLIPLPSESAKPGETPSRQPLRIALVGHSYLTQESYANLNLLKKLRAKAEVELVQHVDPEDIDSNLLELRKKLFWSHSKQIFGAGNKFVADPQIHGIIYLTCFGCGTDSIVQELLSRKVRQQHKPYMVVTLDEHSGEAGLITRLEAFLDMVERRRVHEGYVSTYGERLDYNSDTF